MICAHFESHVEGFVENTGKIYFNAKSICIW